MKRKKRKGKRLHLGRTCSEIHKRKRLQDGPLEGWSTAKRSRLRGMECEGAKKQTSKLRDKAQSRRRADEPAKKRYKDAARTRRVL